MQTVPDGQWKIFLGNLCCLLVKNNYALKIGVQTYQPTQKKEGFTKENDQDTDSL